MIWHRKIVLTIDYIGALSKLVNAGRNQALTYKSSPGEFILFRSVANRYKKSIFSFCFAGKVTEKNGCTILEYKAFPSSSVYIAAVVFCIPLISGIADLCIGSGSVTFVIIGILINMLFWILVICQVYQCMEQFEKHFQVDG